MPRIWIARSCNSSIFNFKEPAKLFFQWLCHFIFSATKPPGFQFLYISTFQNYNPSSVTEVVPCGGQFLSLLWQRHLFSPFTVNWDSLVAWKELFGFTWPKGNLSVRTQGKWRWNVALDLGCTGLHTLNRDADMTQGGWWSLQRNELCNGSQEYFIALVLPHSHHMLLNLSKLPTII